MSDTERKTPRVITPPSRRVAVRYPAFLEIEVEYAGQRHHGVLHDISASGCFIESDFDFDVGQQITVHFSDHRGSGSTGVVYLRYALRASVATVVTRAGVIGNGVTWDTESPTQTALLRTLISDLKERPLPVLSVEAQNSRRWSALVIGALLFYVVCLVLRPSLWTWQPLRHVAKWSWQLGIVAGATIALGMVIAFRRRGQLGLRSRGSYGRWLAFHVIGSMVAFVALALHVCDRRGRGIPFVGAILVLAIALSALPRLWLWKQMPQSRVSALVLKHWLKVHVLLIGPTLVAVAWHVMQVIVF